MSTVSTQYFKMLIFFTFTMNIVGALIRDFGDGHGVLKQTSRLEEVHYSCCLDVSWDPNGQGALSPPHLWQASQGMRLSAGLGSKRFSWWSELSSWPTPWPWAKHFTSAYAGNMSKESSKCLLQEFMHTLPQNGNNSAYPYPDNFTQFAKKKCSRAVLSTEMCEIAS